MRAACSTCPGVLFHSIIKFSGIVYSANESSHILRNMALCSMTHSVFLIVLFIATGSEAIKWYTHGGFHLSNNCDFPLTAPETRVRYGNKNNRTVCMIECSRKSSCTHYSAKVSSKHVKDSTWECAGKWFRNCERTTWRTDCHFKEDVNINEKAAIPIAWSECGIKLMQTPTPLPSPSAPTPSLISTPTTPLRWIIDHAHGGFSRSDNCDFPLTKFGKYKRFDNIKSRRECLTECSKTSWCTHYSSTVSSAREKDPAWRCVLKMGLNCERTIFHTNCHLKQDHNIERSSAIHKDSSECGISLGRTADIAPTTTLPSATRTPSPILSTPFPVSSFEAPSPSENLATESPESSTSLWPSTEVEASLQPTII